MYKKIDSALRGPVAAEIESVLLESRLPVAIIAPAFPGNGRTTLGGVQMIHGEPVHETQFAKDPVTPALEGHIPSLLAEAGLQGICTLGIEYIDEPHRVRRALSEHRWVVADATEDTHLESLVKVVPEPEKVLWAGSAGLVKALGVLHPGPGTGENLSREHAKVDRVLIVVGTMNEVSRQQLRHLKRDSRVEVVELPATEVPHGVNSRLKNTVRAVEGSLKKGKSVTLCSTDEELPEGSTGNVVKDLAEVVAGVSEDSFDALVLTGGDTAINVSRGLGAQGIMLEGEIEPGVTMGVLIGPGPYRVITKAGGFGSPETLLNALHAFVGKGKRL